MTGARISDTGFPAFKQHPDSGCFGIPTSVFFPPDTGKNPDLANYAKRFCTGCPFRVPCAEWAIAHVEWGVWGGTTYMERRRIRAARKAASMPTAEKGAA